MTKRSFAAVMSVGLLLAALAGADEKKTIVPKYEIVTTRNGVPIFFFPSPNVPLFEVHLNFKGGGDLDPPRRSGLGLFALGMIRRGAEGIDEDAISRKLDDVAGSIDVNVDEEDATVASFGLNAHAGVINEEMFRELQRPTFPAEPFKRLKHNHLDGIAQLPDSPGGLASQVLDSLVFNRTIKERPTSGLRHDVERITLAEARAYYPNLIRTDKLRALVIGGNQRDVLNQVIAGIEGLSCPSCGRAVPSPRPVDFPPARIPKGAIVLVDRPGISEAHVRMGFIGPKRDIPEFYDLRVAETILSGYFASRLNLIIREKLSLTYGISAGFNFGTTTGEFTVSSSTRQDKLADLLIAVNRVLGGFVGGDATDGEIQMAREYLTGSFPLGLENLYVIAGAFFNGLLNGLHTDFMDHYIDRVSEVTRASLNEAVRKYMPLDQMKTVVVGDSKIIGPQLKKAKLKFVTRSAEQFL